MGKGNLQPSIWFTSEDRFLPRGELKTCVWILRPSEKSFLLSVEEGCSGWGWRRGEKSPARRGGRARRWVPSVASGDGALQKMVWIGRRGSSRSRKKEPRRMVRLWVSDAAGADPLARLTVSHRH